MNGLRIGEAKVDVENGEIRNGFRTISLTKKLEVVVPTLVLIDAVAEQDEHAFKEMFTLGVERRAERSRHIRVAAECACETCSGLHLGTDFFRPREGAVLNSCAHPSVLSHTFGLIGLMLGGVPELYDEVKDDHVVGRIVPIGTATN